MKKVLNFQPLGQRFKTGTLEYLQAIPTELAQAIIQSLFGIPNNSTTAYVLYGCVNSGSGSTYVISAGAVYYNGEVYRVPAVTLTVTTGVPVANIVSTPQTDSEHDPVELSDGSSNNVHITDTFEITEDTTGSGAADYLDFAKPQLVGSILLGESAFTATATDVSSTVHTFTPSSSLSGACLLSLNAELHPAAGGGSTNYVVQFDVLVAGVNVLTKKITVTNNGAWVNFDLAKKINYNAGDVVQIQAFTSITASCGITARAFVQGTKVA